MKWIARNGAYVLALGSGFFAGLIATAYAALILAEFGLFRAMPCLLIGGVTGTGVAFLAIRQTRLLQDGEILGWLAAGTLALGSLALTLPPSEMILGGWDPGVYLHTAAAIADQGSLQFEASDIARVPAADRSLLYREAGSEPQPFGAMYLLPNGNLSPRFMHLYPSLMAVGFSLFGIWGSLSVNPLLNVAAILMLYGVASVVVGRRWALAAALLLALNPAQIWQAKFSTAEMMGQVLLLAGFATLLRFVDTPRGVLTPIFSGVFFGLALLSRYDAILVVVPVVLLLLLFRHEREYRRQVFAFILTVSLISVHVWIHTHVIAPYYHPVPNLVRPILTLALGGAILLAIGLQMKLGQRLIVPVMARRRWFQLAGSGLFIGLIVFAWYVRPHLTVPGRVANGIHSLLTVAGRPEWFKSLKTPDALNMYCLQAIFGGLGLFLGCAGVVALAWTSHGRGVAIWLVASVAVSAILILSAFNEYFMMWISRRYIPVVIPLLTIGIVASAATLYRGVRQVLPRTAAALALALVLLVPLLGCQKIWTMATTREWPGLVAWVDRLSAMIPGNATVYCDQPGFAAPLRFLHGIRAYEIANGKTCIEFVRERQPTEAAAGGPVCILTMRPQPGIETIRTECLGRLSLVSYILQQPRYDVPTSVKQRSGQFELDRILTSREPR